MSFSLRPINPDDADWIFEACQDPLIQQWTQIPRPYSRDHALAFTKDLGGDIAVWSIVADDSSIPYGVIGVHSITGAIADIGYWIAPWGRRKGAAKSGLQLLISELTLWPGIRLIEARIGDGNVASRKTAESAGFHQTDTQGLSCRCGDSEVSAISYQFSLKKNLPLL